MVLRFKTAEQYDRAHDWVAAAILEAPGLEELEALYIDSAPIGDDAALSLVKSLPALRALKLIDANLSPDFPAALAALPQASRLQLLELNGEKHFYGEGRTTGIIIEPEDLAALASVGGLRPLEIRRHHSGLARAEYVDADIEMAKLCYQLGRVEHEAPLWALDVFFYDLFSDRL